MPIVEPEVLMDGDHSLKRCAQESEKVFAATFRELKLAGVIFEAMCLKPNMIIKGKGNADPISS